jgi:hypothetical protein
MLMLALTQQMLATARILLAEPRTAATADGNSKRG